MKNILKSNVKLFYAIIVTSILLLSLSYGTFILTSDKYNASELLVGNLLYGITIHDTNKQEQTNPVTVGDGDTILYITISSVNSINSKYTLAYDNNNVTVKSSNKSGWNASGSMTSFQTHAYSKTVKVVVTNNSGTNQTVTFAAFGGYSYNSTANISLGNGYYTVANFTDVTSTSGKQLTQIVEEDTNCSSNNCLYGGEASTNYFSFEEDGDLYRIIGTYLVDNEKTTKIATNTLTETTSPSNLNNVLNTIKNEIDTDNIYSTNKFNCQGVTSLNCTSSSYSDVGILSLDEYKGLEGDVESSYLYNSNSYYLLNGNNLVSNNNQNETPTSAYVRPSMYLDNEVTVVGSGTVDDPYIIESQADFNLVAMYLQNDTTSTALSNYTETNSMPASGYVISETNTYCTVNGVVDNSAIITTTTDGYVGLANLQKGSKCYLYFDLDPGCHGYGVPMTYTCLEYLESTSGPYINTGVIPDTNTSAYMEIAFTRTGNHNSYDGIGSAMGNLNSEFRVFHEYGNIVFSFGTNNRTYRALTTTDKVKIEFGNGVSNAWFEDGTEVPYIDERSTIPTTTLSSTSPIYIFAVSSSGTLWASSAYLRVYYLVLYENGIEVRKFYPVSQISNNILGMYDVVNNVFYTNAGSGTFTPGPEI